MPSKEYDIPRFILNNNITDLIGDNAQLMMDISNSNGKIIDDLINQTKNINKYSLKYGNNPILLAISKGWNHIKVDNIALASEIAANIQSLSEQMQSESYKLESYDGLKKAESAFSSLIKKYSELQIQKTIINKILEREDLDVNCIYLPNGMTPLHIACLRGDPPKLIQKLLDKRADPNAIDYHGNKPIDLLNCEYNEVKDFLEHMTDWKFGKDDCGRPIPENRSATVTLPTRKGREGNIKKIKEILSKNMSQEKEQSSTNSSTTGKPLATKINSLQIEAQNSVER